MEILKKYPRLLLLLFLAFLAALSIYIGFGGSDNNVHTPMLYRMIDNSYLANDWFTNVNSEAFNVRFYFNLFLRGIYFLVPNLALVYFIVYLLIAFSIALSSYLISAHLFKNKEIASLTAFFVLFGVNFMPGGNVTFHILNNILTANALSFSFSLWGFYCLIKKRYSLFSLSSGIATLFHFISGGLIFGVLFLAELINNLHDKKNLKTQLKSLFIFILISLLLFPIILSQLNNSLSLSGKELLFIMAIFRSPIALLPSSWGALKWLAFIFFCVFFLISLKSAQIKKPEKSLARNVLIIVLSIYLIGFIFIEIIPLGLIIKAYVFKASSIVLLIGYILIIPCIYENFKISESSFERLFYLALAISLFHHYLFVLLFPFFIIVRSLRTKKINVFKGTIFRILVITIAIIAVILLSVFYHRFLALFISLITEKLGSLTLLLSKIALFIPFFALVLLNKKYLKIIAVCSILLTCSLLFFAKPSMIYYVPDSDSQELFNFIKTNTPADAIFLAPPDNQYIRLHAARAVVADFKAIPFFESSMKEWFSRIEDLTGNQGFEKGESIENYLKNYNNLTENDINALKLKYKVSYAIFEKPSSLNLKKEFENNQFVIYSLN